MSLGYQALYTVPRWRRLVGSHLEATGTTGAQALGLLLAFGAFYNVHNIAQVWLQERLLSVWHQLCHGPGAWRPLHSLGPRTTTVLSASTRWEA